jgi:HPt (histidine-containing phosphotransfer) domain-containing protein
MKYIIQDDSEKILELGLEAMTKACESLDELCQQQNAEIEDLRAKVSQLEERLLLNREERE